MSENDVVSVIRSRISILESQRAEPLRTLASIDAALNELRFLLSRLTGESASEPSPRSLTMVNPAVTSPKVETEVVLSPKSSTPVMTNAAILRRSLGAKTPIANNGGG